MFPVASAKPFPALNTHSSLPQRDDLQEHKTSSFWKFVNAKSQIIKYPDLYESCCTYGSRIYLCYWVGVGGEG